MLKGLLIRALTICNNQNDFLRAAIHYTQGLISRGFPAKTLWRAWRKFSCEKIDHPSARRNLTNQFRTWLDDQDLSGSHPDEAAKCKQRYEATLNHFKQSVKSALPSLNHILCALKLPTISNEEVDAVAHEMADRESNLLGSQDPTQILKLAADPRGNQAADLILYLLRTRTGLGVERWRPEQPISSCAFLLGAGNHWQAVLMDADKQWFVLEHVTKLPLQNVTFFLNNKLKCMKQGSSPIQAILIP